MPRNPYVCLTIICVLGTSIIIGLVGVIVLACNGREAPSALVAIVSGAMGSLSSFLVSVPRNQVGWTGEPGGTPPGVAKP